MPRYTDIDFIGNARLSMSQEQITIDQVERIVGDREKEIARDEAGTVVSRGEILEENRGLRVFYRESSGGDGLDSLKTALVLGVSSEDLDITNQGA